MLKIVTGNTKERRTVERPVFEWEVRALKESAQVMVQSEHEEEQKYIECVLVMVQSERDEEQKKAQPRLLMLAVCQPPQRPHHCSLRISV